MSPSEYNARSAAWKAGEALVRRLRESDDDTEAVLGDAIDKLTTIRQDLTDERRAKVFQGAIAR